MRTHRYSYVRTPATPRPQETTFLTHINDLCPHLFLYLYTLTNNLTLIERLLRMDTLFFLNYYEPLLQVNDNSVVTFLQWGMIYYVITEEFQTCD